MRHWGKQVLPFSQLLQSIALLAGIKQIVAVWAPFAQGLLENRALPILVYVYLLVRRSKASCFEPKLGALKLPGSHVKSPQGTKGGRLYLSGTYMSGW